VKRRVGRDHELHIPFHGNDAIDAVEHHQWARTIDLHNLPNNSEHATPVSPNNSHIDEHTNLGYLSQCDPRMRDDLPRLKGVSSAKRDAVFQQKLQLCSVKFDLLDPKTNSKHVEIKRETLLELKDYVNSPSGQKIFKEDNIPAIISMVRVNIFRALPKPKGVIDLEDEEMFQEPSWPHLQIVYDFLLRFVMSAEVSAKVAKRHIDQQFCLCLINLFESEDVNEREYLKTILHRIYGKIMHHRGFIRRSISNSFYRFVYETDYHPGIAELLEILGSIINGFAKPLKAEHVSFLKRALLPLHKPRNIKYYHQHLAYCAVQFVEKDIDTVIPIVKSMCKWWPWTSSAKQLLLLAELEEILEACSSAMSHSSMSPADLKELKEMVARLLAQCVGSVHFQVAERSLMFWNNEHLIGGGGVLSMAGADVLLAPMLAPARRHADGHWNAVIERLAQNLLKMFMDQDPELFQKCTEEQQKMEAERSKRREATERRWELLRARAEEIGGASES